MSLTIKRGDTIEIYCQYTDENNAGLSLNAVTIKSQIRDKFDKLLADFDIEVINAANGDYVMRVFDTTNMPIGDVFFDIQYEYGGKKASTDTQTITVIKDITK